MKFSSKKWQITGLVTLIVISIAIFIQYSLGLGIFRDDVKGMFLHSFSKNIFRKQSQLSVSMSGNRLDVAFALTPEDTPIMNRFLRNWFGITDPINQLSLETDKNTGQFLNPILPADLGIQVTDKTLAFNNLQVPSLQNALIKNDFEFATGSGKLNIKYTDNTKYQLRIENPSDLAGYATASGMLTASEKLSGLFKSLPQVATIELNVNGKNISGQIVLK